MQQITKSHLSSSTIRSRPVWDLSRRAASHLRSVLEGLIPAGYTDIGRVAEIVGMSQRTLQQQLRARGDRFSDVLARTRLSLARRLLDDPSMKVIDLAFELGYSDHAHFTSAFRRWTGLPPRDFRKAQHSPVPRFEPKVAVPAVAARFRAWSVESMRKFEYTAVHPEESTFPKWGVRVGAALLLPEGWTSIRGSCRLLWVVGSATRSQRNGFIRHRRIV